MENLFESTMFLLPKELAVGKFICRIHGSRRVHASDHYGLNALLTGNKDWKRE